MKKEIIILFVFFLSLISLSLIASAGVEINIGDNQDEFYQSQLLQAEVLGSFPEGLAIEDISIYQQGQVHPTPTESNLLQRDTKYLFYAVLPSIEGNYSIKIKDTKYWYGQEIKEDEIEENFTIVSTLDPYISVDQGFILATGDFKITVQSLNAVQNIKPVFKATGESFEKEVGYNAKKTFTFSIDSIKIYTESVLTIGDYKIPVFVYPEEQDTTPFIDPDFNISEEDINTGTNTTPYEDVTLETATPQQIQTCADLNGNICKKNQKCLGSISQGKDVVCCMGNCEDIPRSYAWIWGLVILVLLAAAALFFYYFSKKKNILKRPAQNIQDKNRDYKQRMGLIPNINPQSESRKSLSRT